jgi:hypothetical protein
MTPLDTDTLPKIIRHYPSTRYIYIETDITKYQNFVKKPNYPIRYTKDVFDKFNEMINNPELMRNYDLFKNGINFKTNRKIKIEGSTYKSLKQYFHIKYNGLRNDETHYVLFELLYNISAPEYLQESEDIYKQIDNKMNEEKEQFDNKMNERKQQLDAKYKETELYNNKVNNVIEQINKLQKWDEYIEFDGKYYGIPEIFNGVHRVNDCFGTSFTKDRFECCRCHLCENWYGCKTPDDRQLYKCNKCSGIVELKYINKLHHFY